MLVDNFLGMERTTLESPVPLAAGEHEVSVSFAYQGGVAGKPAAVKLSVDGSVVAWGRVETTIPIRLSLDETLDSGEDTGTPVSEEYHVPFGFTGQLDSVDIDLQ